MSHDPATTTTASATALAPPVDVEEMADVLLRDAGEADAGRAARSLIAGSGAPLKQTVLALAAGRSLQEHVAPGPATLLVLRGTVALGCAGDRREVAEGGWIPIPEAKHDLAAVTDAVVLLTVVAVGPSS